MQPAAALQLLLLSWITCQMTRTHTPNPGLLSVKVGIKHSDIKNDD